MKRSALLAAGFCMVWLGTGLLQREATAKMTVHVGQTVYAASDRSVGFAYCEVPEGQKQWTDGFPKPQLDAHSVPKTLFTYKAGDPLKVVELHVYTWTYEGNHNSERFWALETRDHHKFCLRDAQLDDNVVAHPK